MNTEGQYIRIDLNGKRVFHLEYSGKAAELIALVASAMEYDRVFRGIIEKAEKQVTKGSTTNGGDSCASTD